MATHKEQVLIRYHYQGVEELFDEYADTFEEHLTLGLRYKTPALMKRQMDLAFGTELSDIGSKVEDDARKSEKERKWKRCLDLGCGSGLAGDIYRSDVQYLEGCDISKEMVKMCKKKEGIYDKVIHNNLMNHLRKQKDASFDLIVSADVVMYLHDNDLDAMIKETFRVLESGGVLCFSTESLDTESEEEHFRRLESERFAHSRKYVLGVAKGHGFECKSVENVRVRMDGGHPIMGDILVLVKA
jgi:predicted TPR repeat methyltransferase